ncbi:hypothetical protein L228DRAFT_284967 [Xylona heveae TC161]|uniref:Zn(2)-C6 fungal-type domain-containing protein n=1 Tax=Xylona heveae (strain CBS 132557 / TC161) TaxID=1328760 RepID=A0A165AC57_XYLHT|nr:hypothetical protein L228DRAFT_284967 [Xylona heveae TC161]KZF20238.1 hypothetical protein L228DRAFT_284967 [Xylona heveae TC161]
MESVESSQSPEAALRPRRRVKQACTECRQQKARCDGYLSQPCSRCRKLAVRCVMSDPFKRENKRQKIAQLEEEARRLRQRLAFESGESTTQRNETKRQTSAFDILTAAAAGFGGDLQSREAVSSGEPSGHPIHGESAVSPAYKVSEASNCRVQSQTRQGEVSAVSTLPRSLDSITLSTKAIDELFYLYFHYLSHYIPILDSSVSPNTYYSESPFLFWVIIAVASRMYNADSNLLHALAPKVLDMAAMLIKSRKAALHTIRGLLLLLTWPMPKGAQNDEASFPLVGALWHMAMHNGLHMPFSSHDPRIKLGEAELKQRAELWIFCTITYQRSCSLVGQSPVLPNSRKQKALVAYLPAPLKLLWKLHSIYTSCCAALLENGLEDMTGDQERAMDIILRIFESQITDTEDEISSDMDRVYYDIALLTVQVFHFFKNPPETTQSPPIPLISLFNTSCRLIDDISSIDQENIFIPKTMTQYFRLAIITAACSLLRIVRGVSAHFFDTDAARTYVFKVVDLLKSASSASEDSYRYSISLSQLWNSQKAFKKPDGSPYTTLRIRARLALSPVYDAVWWWREEFGRPAGDTGIYLRNDAPSPGSTAGRPNALQLMGSPSIHSASYLEPQTFSALSANDPFLSDFGFGPYDFAFDSAAFFPLDMPYELTSGPFPLDANGVAM